MGCFLACFGGDKERRRRKHNPIKRIPSREVIKPKSPRRQQLRSSPSKLPHGPSPLLQEAVAPDPRPEFRDASQGWSSPCEQVAEQQALPSPLPKLSDEGDEKLNFSSLKKKVTFDLNIQIYENASVCDDDVCSSLEAAEEAKTSGEEEKPQKGGERSNTDPLGAGVTALNHRYHNCMISDEEDVEEDGEGDYDIGDESDEGEEEEEDGDTFEDCDFDANQYALDGRGNDEEESYDSYFSLPLEREKQFFTEVNSAATPAACSSPDRQLAGAAGQPARDRSQYVHAVLNPVENLIQWKDAKAKTHQTKHSKKENKNVELGSDIIPFSSPPNVKSPRLQKASYDSSPNLNGQTRQEVSVDASLSTWLPSNETTPLEGSKGNNSCRTNSTVSVDDRPILGALTMADLKKLSVSSSPRRSPSRSPDEIPILGTVGSYWNCTKGNTDSGSLTLTSTGEDTKGIPNTTSKYREDKRVNWHSTPFQVRLERALNRGDAEAYSSFPPAGC